MNIQDFFRSLDKNEFIKHYLKYDENTHGSDENGELYQYFTDLCNYKELKPNSDKAIIWAVAELGTHLLHSFLIKEKDLYKKSLPRITYAYEFCDVGEILNFEVSKACIYAFGEFNYASAILYELTFFGYSLDIVEKTVSDKVSELNSAIEEIESGNVNLISGESVFKNFDFKDSKLNFEKAFDEKNNLLDNKIYTYQIKNLINLEKNYHGII